MKAVLFDNYFKAPDELNEFCESIGYKNPDYSGNFNLMFDERIVRFCEQRLTRLWNEMVYKGKESFQFKVGFAGAGYIRDIDTTRKWKIEYNNVDVPVVCYVDVKVNDYGYVSVISGGNMDFVKEAVEKQKAKKPTPIDYKKYMNTVNNAISLRGAYWCPNCKHTVRSGNYCNNCGQAIDWSDIE